MAAVNREVPSIHSQEDETYSCTSVHSPRLIANDHEVKHETITPEMVSSATSKAFDKPVSQSVDPSSSESDYSDLKNYSNQSRSIHWAPSLLRVGPLFGLGALLFAFIQIVASYAVLQASDGDRVDNWKFQPSVYLAILTAISNKALAFAMVQGTVITFWSRVLEGTTLGQLHRDWAFGLHVWKALAAGRHFNILAAACICATFVATDGPLLQRASSVQPEVPKEPITLSVSLSPQVPAYWSGVSEISFSTSTLTTRTEASPDFLPVMKAYLANEPMDGSSFGCSGKCTATLRAPALAEIYCGETFRFANYTKPLSREQRDVFLSSSSPFVPLGNEVFFVSTTVVREGLEKSAAEILWLNIAISDDALAKDCIGYVNWTSCLLVSATAEYPVTILDNVIHLDGHLSYPKLVGGQAHNTKLTNKTIKDYNLKDGPLTKTTLSGIAFVAQMKFYTVQGYVTVEEGQWGLVGGPTWFSEPHLKNEEAFNNGTACAPSFSDPRAQVMAGLNEIMFRTGLYTAQNYNESWLKSRIDNGLEITTNVTGVPLTPVDVFKTDFYYFAGAAAIELLTILMVLFTFYGWWRLGRNFTFSPLEIAKAFDAPLLAHVPSNQPARKIAKDEGEQEVQYGVRSQAGIDLEKLVIAERSSVHKPISERRTTKEWYILATSKSPLGSSWGSQAKREESNC